jgi:hypothetical protein
LVVQGMLQRIFCLQPRRETDQERAVFLLQLRFQDSEEDLEYVVESVFVGFLGEVDRGLR